MQTLTVKTRKIDAKYPERVLFCPTCKREVKTQNKYFCSKKCMMERDRSDPQYTHISAGLPKGAVVRKRSDPSGLFVRSCKECSSTYETWNEEQQFCGHECYRDSQHRKLDEQGYTLGRECPVCQGEIADRYSVTCSRKCGRTFFYHNGDYRETSIERVVRIELERREVGFRAQVEIGPFVVDFLLSDKTVIECDGTYWHSFPDMQKRDRMKDYFLRHQGLSVVRISDRQINSGEWVTCLFK